MLHKSETSNNKIGPSSALKQLAKEFIVPLTIAVLWTAYNLWDLRAGDRSIKNFINIFGPAFFLASWGISQWFRVRKQQKVDQGLTSIEAAVNSSIANLEAKTTEVINNVTGGDSACYVFGPTPESDRWIGLLIVHVGKYPLYEVTCRVTELDIFEEMLNNNEPLTENDRSEFRFAIGPLAPNMGRRAPIDLPLGPKDSRRFNLFFTARNGSTTQLIRCKKIDGEWKFATQLKRSDQVLYERIDDGYPRLGTGEIDWH